MPTNKVATPSTPTAAAIPIPVTVRRRALTPAAINPSPASALSNAIWGQPSGLRPPPNATTAFTTPPIGLVAPSQGVPVCASWVRSVGTHGRKNTPPMPTATSNRRAECRPGSDPCTEATVSPTAKMPTRKNDQYCVSNRPAVISVTAARRPGLGAFQASIATMTPSNTKAITSEYIRASVA